MERAMGLDMMRGGLKIDGILVKVAVKMKMP